MTWFKWGIDKLGIGGGGVEDDFMTAGTGSAILGGSGAGEYKGDMGKSSLIFGTGKSSSGLMAASHSLILEVTDKESWYNLAAYYDGKQIFSLANKVTVRFDYPAPDPGGRLFVLFKNSDGSLTAFAANYNALTGQLVFSGDELGDFMVVCTDFDGKLFSDEFYDFLDTLDSVKAFRAGS